MKTEFPAQAGARPTMIAAPTPWTRYRDAMRRCRAVRRERRKALDRIDDPARAKLEALCVEWEFERCAARNYTELWIRSGSRRT